MDGQWCEAATSPQSRRDSVSGGGSERPGLRDATRAATGSTGGAGVVGALVDGQSVSEWRAGVPDSECSMVLGLD